MTEGREIRAQDRQRALGVGSLTDRTDRQGVDERARRRGDGEVTAAAVGEAAGGGQGLAGTGGVRKTEETAVDDESASGADERIA